MKVLELGIKGRVKVVVTNVKTGKVVQVIEQDNVITDNGANLLINAWLNGKYLKYKASPTTNDGAYIGNYGRPYWALVLGTGTGTPSSSDTSLFVEQGHTARGAGQDGIALSITTDPDTGEDIVNITKLPYGAVAELTSGTRYWEYHVRYTPEEINGYTYTELGIYENIPYHWYLVNETYHEYYIPPQHYTEGVLFNHVVLQTPIQKTPDIMIDVYVRIQIQP